MRTALGVTARESVDIADDAQVELTNAGPVRTACWVGSQAEAFATGHEMGQVLVWMIPLDASGEYASCHFHALSACQQRHRATQKQDREAFLSQPLVNFPEGEGPDLSNLLTYPDQQHALTEWLFAL